MKLAGRSLFLCLVACLGPMTAASAGAESRFDGGKSAWHGFDRYDYLMDDADLSIEPYQPPPNERTAVRGPVKGKLRCVVVAPKQPAPGNPWTWRGYYFDHEPQAEIELLKRGFHVGFVWCDADKHWDAWYGFLTEKHGLSKKPAFVGMSRGGRNAYTWATAHPDQVSAIYADNPAVESRGRRPARRPGEKRRAPVARLRQSRPDPGQPHPGRRKRLPAAGRPNFGDDQGRSRPPPAQPSRPQADRGLHRAEPAAEEGRIAVFRWQGFHEDFVLQQPERLSGGPEREDVRRLPRPLVRPGLRPLRIPIRRAFGCRCRLSCRRRRLRASRGSSGRTSRRATRWSIWPCWTRVFTSSPGLCPPIPTGRSLSSGTRSTSTWFDAGLSKTPVMEGRGGAAGEAYAWADREPGQGQLHLRREPDPAQPHDQGPAARPARRARQGRRAAVARLRQPRPLAGLPDAGPRKTLQGTRRPDHRPRRGRQGHFPTGAEGPQAGRRFHPRPTNSQGRGPRTVAGPRLPVRPDHHPAGAGELPVPGDLDGRPAQRPRRPRRQHPHAQSHRGQVRRPGPLLVGRRSQPTPESRTGPAADPEGPRRRSGHGSPGLRLRDRDDARSSKCRSRIGRSSHSAGRSEKRNFRYADMLYPDGRRQNQWGRNASVPDVSRPETKLWFYFLAASYIDLGCEAIHFGQAELMNGNDRDLAHWSQVLDLVRAYAAKHARRHMVLCDAHVPSGGLVRDGQLLLDFHSFPLRIKEVPDKPQEAILKVGFSDGIYGRSKGGVTPSGWACEHLPYLVETGQLGRQPASRVRPGRAASGSGATTRSPGSPPEHGVSGELAPLCPGLGTEDGPERLSADARQPDDAVAAGRPAVVLREQSESGGPRRPGRRRRDPLDLGRCRRRPTVDEFGTHAEAPASVRWPALVATGRGQGRPSQEPNGGFCSPGTPFAVRHVTFAQRTGDTLMATTRKKSPGGLFSEAGKKGVLGAGDGLRKLVGKPWAGEVR